MTVRLDLRALARVIRRNFLLKLFSLGFAVGLWAFVNLGARDAEKTMLVPLDLRNLPASLMVVNPIVDVIDVRLRGPRTLLETIDEGRQRVSLDLASVRPGTTSFKVDPEALNLPRGVRVVRVSPVQVTLELERVIERLVPVAASFAGSVPSGYHIADLEIRPPQVSLIGPAHEVEPVKSVLTSPLELPPGPATFEIAAVVERPGELVRVSPERVTVRGRVEEIVASRRFRGVDVGVRNADGPFRLRPPQVEVTVRGPQRLLDGLELSRDHVFVNLEGLAPGVHRDKIKLALPEGLEAIEVKPAEIAVQILARAHKST
jgi:YbbR domain-containing protein